MKKPTETQLKWWYDQLDSTRQSMENHQDDYSQELDAFEEECGKKLREEYENRYA